MKPEAFDGTARRKTLLLCASSLLQGLSQETIEFVLSHPSNAYDRCALAAGWLLAACVVACFD